MLWAERFSISAVAVFTPSDALLAVAQRAGAIMGIADMTAQRFGPRGGGGGRSGAWPEPRARIAKPA